jgi:hydroxymethylbilane synthase
MARRCILFRSMKSLTIGTRGSQLALWQAHWVERQLQARGIATRIEIIKTTGDKITDLALAKVGASAGLKGVFTKEIEEALLGGQIDLAVHSLKDLPADLDERLALGAIPERADPRDALAGRTLKELPPGAKVGTSSLRRAAQLRHLRPDLLVENIRGNIDTRLRKLDEGLYDAILLASAGLHRMGWQDRIAETLDPQVMAPAIGQGALGIEIRAGDGATREILKPLNHPATAIATSAERALLRALGGGCQVPLGAYTRLDDGRLVLGAVVVSPDGKTLVRATVEGSSEDPEGLGRRAAQELRAQGAEAIMRNALDGTKS